MTNDISARTAIISTSRIAVKRIIRGDVQILTQPFSRGEARERLRNPWPRSQDQESRCRLSSEAFLYGSTVQSVIHNVVGYWFPVGCTPDSHFGKTNTEERK